MVFSWQEEEKELQNLSEDEREVYEPFVRSKVKGQTSQSSARSDSSLIVYEDKDFISHLSSSPEAKVPVPLAMMLQEENGSSGTNYFEPMNVDDEYEAVFGSPCEQGVIEGARLEDEPGCSNSEYIGKNEMENDEKNNELGNGSSSLSHLMIIRSEHLYIEDITRGMEDQKISLINEVNREELQTFNYTLKSIPYQNARVKFPLAQISLNDCCSSCTSDCLSSGTPCLCAKKSGGEFAYKTSGVVKDEFIDKCEQKLAFCEVCPLKRSKKTLTGKCKGHVIRKFIKECWFKCGCCKTCGNRTLQHGITAKLQVFMTPEGKGWGLRTLEDLPKGTFICEYVGEIITTMELVERNMKNMDMQHSYNVVLDADWRSSRRLKNEEALCLDGASYGNVARFINHRCHDANMIDIPVEVETPDRHCYHVAFFTTREVKAMEELNWVCLLNNMREN
ncbi:histone modifying enzyme [Lithospermum erythrorhizon]|uniref:Histone modifying enzyme n=1 Tax=Lithospermum erythrorhizon TaxID=34254 RepID=A0AAV3PG69_LITER